MSSTDPSRQKKVLFFAESVTLAHMARPAVLAGMLQHTEFEAVIATDPRYLNLFPDLSVRTVGLFSLSSAEFIDALAKGRPLYTSSLLERYVEEDLRLIDEEEPDIVVGDFRLSLSVSARLRKIPYIAISNAYWSPHARVSYAIPELPMTGVLGVRLAQALFSIVRPAVFAMHTLPLNKVRGKYGLKPLGMNLNRVYTDSDYVLYADVPSLVEMFDLPDNHQFLGPVLWSPEHTCPDWWPEIDGVIPNIYVTLGSSGRNDLLPVVLNALKELPVRLLVSTAGSGALNISASNIFTADYLPGAAAAGKSSLVICNGGSLTTYQAFGQGVPVIGIAGNLDQHLNMLAVEKSGAGIRLRTENLATEQLRAAVIKILQEKAYARSAEAIRERMDEMDTRGLFLNCLRVTSS